jgi:hypothetical protein
MTRPAPPANDNHLLLDDDVAALALAARLIRDAECGRAALRATLRGLREQAAADVRPGLRRTPGQSWPVPQ